MLETAAAFVRLGLYAGLLIAGGLALATVSLRLRADERLQSLARAAAAVAAACAAGTFVLLLARLGALSDAAVALAILQTPSGLAMSLQLAGAAILLTAGTKLPPLAAGGALIAATSFAVNGHAASAGLASSVAIFLHVSIAAWWVAALLLLLVACRREPIANLSALLHRFTGQATVLVILLIVAGGVALGFILNFDPRHLVSPYGAVFAGKIGLVAATLLIVAANRFRHAPRIAAGDDASVQSLARSIRLELAVIGGVLAATAALTTWTSPHA